MCRILFLYMTVQKTTQFLWQEMVQPDNRVSLVRTPPVLLIVLTIISLSWVSLMIGHELTRLFSPLQDEENGNGKGKSTHYFAN